jgi:hypothetical protein
MTQTNRPSGITSRLTIKGPWPGLPEPARSANMSRFPPLCLIAALVLGCSGCGSRESSVKDIAKNETIILKKKPSQGSIVGISIAGRGSIAGKAEVQLILNGAVYKQEEISGNISFKWGGDWYSDQAEVRYYAGTATNGTLTLKYEFGDL